MAWGGTVYNIIEKFRSELRDDLTFTQFIGENMKYNSAAGSTRMTERAASKFQARYLTMPAPLYIESDVIRKLLPQEPALKKTFASARRMDLLFCGLGTLSSINSIPQWKQNRQSLFPLLKQNEVVGVLFGRPYDIDGNFINQKSDKTFGVDLQTILATPRRVGVIKSKFKTNAALGALRGNMLTDLITNESIAQRILLADGPGDNSLNQ